MNKQEFLSRLKQELSGLPKQDVEERLNFYEEMIDDRKEEGLTEEEAVAEIGTVEEIAAQIIKETPLSKLVKEKVRPKRSLHGWEIALLIAGSPVWVPLLIAAFAVILSVYISVWAVIISFWTAALSVGVSALGGLVCAAVYVFQGFGGAAAAIAGVSLVCAGLSILMYLGSLAATKGIILLTGKFVSVFKGILVRKGE